MAAFVILGCEYRNQSDDLHQYVAALAWRDPNSGTMTDRTYIVRFKEPQARAELFVASSAEIQGDHIVLLNSNGQLAALLLLEFVESWNEL